MISILCPSRGRPELAKKMIDTALALAGAPVQVLLYINDDDPKLDQYIELIDRQHLVIGPDRSPAYSWNKLAELAQYDIFFLMGDDAWFETENWAVKIADVFDQYPDKLVFAFPSVDGLPWRGGTLTADHCPHFCVHRNWVNTLGYFVPPQFWHWYIDTWFRDIAKMIGRFHPIKHVSVPLLVDFEDETDSRKDRLSNRERDHWLWPHTQRWLHADAYALQQQINKHALNFKKD
jgi:hypothetical protein